MELPMKTEAKNSWITRKLSKDGAFPGSSAKKYSERQQKVTSKV